jgi:type I restriction enzyme M protein
MPAQNIDNQQKSSIAENLFCKRANLTNEASVETWFIDKLLNYLGYVPEDIKLKTSLKEFKVGKGSKSEFYKPDYIIQINGFPALVIDAKSPSENIEDWTAQCSSYCLELNKEYPHKPVEYFLISNGLKTSLYKWDERKSKVDLDFVDFKKENASFTKLTSYISKINLCQLLTEKQNELMESEFELRSASINEVSDLFSRIHNFIWRTEKKTPSAAFEELMKIVFIKLKKDRELHKKFKDVKPKIKDVVFSVAWIKNQTEHENPINNPLFKNLINDLEKEIIAKDKKRIFEIDEDIELNPSTIEKIVGDLEHIDFSAMDDGETDIHGRMFETFLNATIRGKDLGQYFTPRDIVELMVELADIQVRKERDEYEIEKVLDACCGSGGFLISAMNDMLKKAKNLAGVSDQDFKKIRKKIVDESITGIDAGSDPPIYRIARMNMYLHGDGGSKIFFADSLDKNIGQVGKSNLEIDEQIQELRKMLLHDKVKFDVILSNPLSH